MRTTVLVPILYREAVLARTLERLAAFRDRMDLEILLVVDVPDPRRANEARQANDALAARFGAIAVYRLGDRGFGSALRHGFARATGEVVIPFMGDASDDAEDIPLLIERIQQGYDVVAGSRYMSGGGIRGNSAKQRFSRLYSRLVRLAGGPPIHDVSNAFKAYRKDLIEQIPTIADSFDISVELTVKAARAGFRIGEVPTVWTNRTAGSSSFSVHRELRRYLRWLMFTLAHRGVGPVPAAAQEVSR